MAPYSNCAQNSPEGATTTATATATTTDEQQQQQVAAAMPAGHKVLGRRSKKQRLLQQQRHDVGHYQIKRPRLSTLQALVDDSVIDIFQPRKVESLSEPSTPQSSSFDFPSSCATNSTTVVPRGVTGEVRIPSCPSASSQPSAGGGCSLPDMASVDQPNSPAAGESATTALLGRRLLGTLLVSLPDGIILECRDAVDDEDAPTATATTDEDDDDEDNCDNDDNGGIAAARHFLRSSPMGGTNIAHARLSTVCRAGQSLLALLHGKGAQTLLLNAFCGHARRRMYARLKWTPSCVRACELLCEFCKDPQSVSRRLASIQLFCVQSANNNGMPRGGDSAARLTFTTRHNASGALIYLDSASIPLLGHFPSEITGKSLFALVHADDAQRVRDAHQQLHATGGVQIVRTPALRLAAYAGHSVTVDAEWAAFVNPWTSTVEMVVGRHTFVAEGSRWHMAAQHQKAAPTIVAHQQQQQLANNNNNNLQQQQHDDALFLQQLFMKHVPATQPNPAAAADAFQQQQQQQHCEKQKLIVVKQEEQQQQQQLDMDMEQSQQQQQPLKWKPNSAVGGDANNNNNSQVYLSYNQINCLENVHRLLKSQSSHGSVTDGESGAGGGAGYRMPQPPSSDSVPPPPPLPNSNAAATTTTADHPHHYHHHPSQSLMGPVATQPSSPPMAPSCASATTAALTRELLHLHDQRWEQRCRAHWRRRLSEQATATTALAAAAAAPPLQTPTSPAAYPPTATLYQHKRPLSQEQHQPPRGIFDDGRGAAPPAGWLHHHHRQQQQPTAKAARCKSERSGAWAAAAAGTTLPEELGPAKSSIVHHHQVQQQQPAAALPAELLALLGAVLQSMQSAEMPSVPAGGHFNHQNAKFGLAAAPTAVNTLGLHPQLLDQLLQSAASARSTLNARLLKQDNNNNNNFNAGSNSS